SALQRHDRLIADHVDRHRGRLLLDKGEGDSTVSAFDRASDAAVCAIAIQKALADERAAQTLMLRVRAALHTGEAIERDGSYVGPTLNRTARIRELAV